MSPLATEPHPQDNETPPLPADNDVITAGDDIVTTNDDVMNEFLSVRVILTEAACSKFKARFSHSVVMTETV